MKAIIMEELRPTLIVIAIGIIGGWIAYLSAQQDNRLPNGVEHIRTLDSSHKIISYEGKKYFYSRVHGSWVIGAEYKE